MDNSYVTVAGRLYGGLAIMWYKLIAPVIQYIGCNPDNRVMAVPKEGVGTIICLFNVHLPCIENFDSCVADVPACLSFIEWLFGQQRENYSNVELCAIGDHIIDCVRIFY